MASEGSTLTSLFAIVLPIAALLAVLVARYNQTRIQPYGACLLAALAGFTVTSAVGVMEDSLLLWFGRLGADLQVQAILAGTIEEAAKSLVVLTLLVGRRTTYGPILGITFGALAGLGFAIAESFMYREYSPSTIDVLGREVVRLVLHLVLGGLDGFAVSRLVNGGFRLRIRAGQLLVASMVRHVLWDAIWRLPPQNTGAQVSARLQHGPT